MLTTLAPLSLYIIIVLAIAGLVLVITWLLGGRHQAPARNQVFESGLTPTGRARIRFPIKFYLIALFFLIFDLEIAFLLLWAYVFKELGAAAFWNVTVFIVVLMIGLIYPWMNGALDIVSYKRRARAKQEAVSS